MAFNLLAKPQRIHPVYNPMQIWVNDTSYAADPGFYFIYDLFVKAPFSPIYGYVNRFKTTRIPQHSTGIYSSFIDLSKHIQNYLGHNIDFDTSTWRFADDKQAVQYKVECRTALPIIYYFGPTVSNLFAPYTTFFIGRFGNIFSKLGLVLSKLSSIHTTLSPTLNFINRSYI
jgi:hypothetical protein